MKDTTFENYLQDRHASIYQGLDDEMGEDFEEWLETLDIDTLLKYANVYGMNRFNAGMREVLERI